MCNVGSVFCQFSNVVKPENQSIQLIELENLDTNLTVQSEFKGGQQMLKSYFEGALKKLNEMDLEIDGSIQIYFEVDSISGKISSVKTYGEKWRNQPGGFRMYSLMIVREMQNWEIAMKDGKKLTTRHIMTFGPVEDKGEIDFDMVAELAFGSKANGNPNDERVYSKGAIPPQFPGGEKHLNKFLYEKIIKPIKDKDPNYSKTIVLLFQVGKEGYISDIVATWNRGSEASNLALKVVSTQMPKWEPAIRNEHPVHSKYALVIKFKTIYTPDMIEELINIK